jgi:hypothetical protein
MEVMRKNGAHFYLAMAIQIKIWVAGTLDKQKGKRIFHP